MDRRDFLKGLLAAPLVAAVVALPLPALPRSAPPPPPETLEDMLLRLAEDRPFVDRAEVFRRADKFGMIQLTTQSVSPVTGRSFQFSELIYPEDFTPDTREDRLRVFLGMADRAMKLAFDKERRGELPLR